MVCGDASGTPRGRERGLTGASAGTAKQQGRAEGDGRAEIIVALAFCSPCSFRMRARQSVVLLYCAISGSGC